MSIPEPFFAVGKCHVLIAIQTKNWSLKGDEIGLNKHDPHLDLLVESIAHIPEDDSCYSVERDNKDCPFYYSFISFSFWQIQLRKKKGTNIYWVPLMLYTR